VAHHLDLQVVGELAVAEGDEVGAVLAGIVADEDARDPPAEVSRDRSRTGSSVEAALYATTSTPMRVDGTTPPVTTGSVEATMTSLRQAGPRVQLPVSRRRWGAAAASRPWRR
jgi:hypothetical protein